MKQLIAVMVAVSVFAGMALEQEKLAIQITQIEPTPLFPKPAGGQPLRQLARLHVNNPGEPVAAVVRVAVGSGGADAQDLGFGDYPHRLRTSNRNENIKLSLKFCRETADWPADAKYRYNLEISEPLTSHHSGTFSKFTWTDAYELSELAGKMLAAGKSQVKRHSGDRGVCCGKQRAGPGHALLSDISGRCHADLFFEVELEVGFRHAGYFCKFRDSHMVGQIRFDPGQYLLDTGGDCRFLAAGADIHNVQPAVCGIPLL